MPTSVMLFLLVPLSWAEADAEVIQTSALEGHEEDLAMTDSEVMQDVPVETADNRASWHSNSTPADVSLRFDPSARHASDDVLPTIQAWQAAASGSSPSKAAPRLPNQAVSDRSLPATSSDSFLSFDD